MVDLLKSKTENVIDFIIEWCEKNGRRIEKERKEKEEDYDRSHLPPSEDSFVEADDEVDELPDKIPKNRKTKKKFAISAEAYGDYNKLGDFKPRVIEKSEE